MTTPAGVTITATRPDGTTEDVTEAVSALYDLLIGSMEWGSGFLTVEDAVPVAHLARVCGFAEADEAERYLAAEIAGLEQQATSQYSSDTMRRNAEEQLAKYRRSDF